MEAKLKTILKTLIAISSALTLAGCNTTTTRVVSVTQTVIPERAKLDIPKPNINNWEFDIPRDTSQRIVKNTTDCKAVKETDYTEQFWKTCGIHPPAKNSNLVVGLDKTNYTKFGNTMEEINTYILKLTDRIEAANKEREYWRVRALEEEKKTAIERKKQLEKSS